MRDLWHVLGLLGRGLFMRQAGGFQPRQVFTGTLDDGRRHAGQLRHGQAVALAGRAWQHVVQEHDAFVVLGGVQVHVGHQRLAFRQHGELEVVRGEQRVGTQLGQALGGGPGQRQAVEGAGAAAHFVHQHQAAVGGVVQDVGGFAHLDHEGRTATGQVIAGADTGEYSVHQRQLATGCRDKAADVRHQHDQGGLAHVGGFTAHVRAGNHQHARIVVQAQVIGHERRGQYLFDHGVTTLADAHAGFFDEAGAVQVKGQGALGQVAQHVQLGQGCGGVLQGR
ncbi:hypothetical protein D3C76_766960 [compost metagenome]